MPPSIDNAAPPDNVFSG